MKLLTPIRPNPRALLARANPLAKLGAAVVVMVALFVSVDLVTPIVVLVVVLACIPLTGVRPADLLARAWPVLIAAVALAILNAVFAAAPGGSLLVEVGPFSLRSGSLAGGIGLGLRVLGVALTGVLALVTIDPTDLADALQQQAHLPPRLAVGALAAFRFPPIMSREYQMLRLARRARGVSAGRSPLAAAGIAAGQLFSLLVSAVRRATRLALAMEARGFGSRPCRSAARRQAMERADWLLVAAGCALAGGAVLVSVTLGTWRFVFA